MGGTSLFGRTRGWPMGGRENAIDAGRPQRTSLMRGWWSIELLRSCAAALCIKRRADGSDATLTRSEQRGPHITRSDGYALWDSRLSIVCECFRQLVLLAPTTPGSRDGHMTVSGNKQTKYPSYSLYERAPV